MGGDLQERKITLPLSHLLVKVNASDKKRLHSILSQTEIEKPQIDEVIGLMQCYGSITYAIDHAKQYAAEAQHSIENFPETDLRQSLTDIADYIVSHQV